MCHKVWMPVYIWVFTGSIIVFTIWSHIVRLAVLLKKQPPPLCSTLLSNTILITFRHRALITSTSLKLKDGKKREREKKRGRTEQEAIIYLPMIGCKWLQRERRNKYYLCCLLDQQIGPIDPTPHFANSVLNPPQLAGILCLRYRCDYHNFTLDDTAVNWTQWWGKKKQKTFKETKRNMHEKTCNKYLNQTCWSKYRLCNPVKSASKQLQSILHEQASSVCSLTLICLPFYIWTKVKWNEWTVLVCLLASFFARWRWLIGIFTNCYFLTKGKPAISH